MSLAARALAFGYGRRTVGAGVALELEPGAVLCLLGPNGSGKTTLFRTLLGLLPPLAGEIRLDGRELARLAPRERARHLAYVPQGQPQGFPFTALEAVLMGRTAHRGPFAAPTAADRRVAAAALAELAIAELAERPVTELSGGQRQLVLIARALAQEARYLVMDEPTASLDFGNQVRVLDEIGRLAARGIGVILSTHAPDHAFACADRVLILHAGHVEADGPPAEVVTAERLRRVYGVEVDLVRAPGLDRPAVVPRLERWARGPT